MSHQCELKEQAAQPALMVRATTPVQELPRVLAGHTGRLPSTWVRWASSPPGRHSSYTTIWTCKRWISRWALWSPAFCGQRRDSVRRDSSGQVCQRSPHRPLRSVRVSLCGIDAVCPKQPARSDRRVVRILFE